MATIRERVDSKGRKTYHVQVRLRGFPPQTQTFESKTLAKQWAAHVETELRNGRYLPHTRARRQTVRDMLDAYRDKILVPLKPKEVRSQSRHLDWWIDKLGAYCLADVTPALIASCRDELAQTPVGKRNPRDRSPATVVRYMAVLSHAFNVAVKEWGWLHESPMSRVTKPKVSNARLRYLSEAELARLLDTAKTSENRYLSVILTLALATGMRHGEIMSLTWGNVMLDTKEKHGLILLAETKNGEPRGVPLVGSAYEAIAALRTKVATPPKKDVPTTALLFPSTANEAKPVDIRKAWQTALARAKVESFRFHDLRHTAASYLAMEGATAQEIAEILGHKSLQMVKRYSHFSKAHIAKVLSRMNQSRLSGKRP